MVCEHKKLHLHLGTSARKRKPLGTGACYSEAKPQNQMVHTVLHHQHVQACDPTTWPLQKVDMWMQKVVGRDGKGMVKSAPKHATTVAAQAEDQGGCTLTIVQAALGSAYQLQALRRSCCCLH